ncbi:Rieske (2Fe-2S) domain protein [Methylocella silvestris BL2]|uniref:Rieske (2Fe-2S) domain protein n=1 Tax=Methylocella silvestris (strain DSM 15510 / CIP 108128 / LMG 27833 / NCIMB 13906 / BL2) TaxID=395965 RepID=B8ESU1_METSB|nr:non-heme iron oxygenase ferredoxin subunit [Methylocella silvestris]ACK50426.1 Rieske (2Fe-2S) domain protein [Methylocella silvestris BL2]
MREPGKWVRATSLAELLDRQVIGVDVLGVPVVVYSVDGEVFATYDICSHGKARLSDGYLEGREIECPLHQGTFDVCTGQAVKAPCIEPVRPFQTKIEHDDVLVFIDD